MFHFLFRKLLRAILILFGVSFIMFLLMHAVPGNPWNNYANSPRMMPGIMVDKSVETQLTRRFGLNLPLWRQYTRYMIGDFNEDGSFFCGVICGNLGPSIQLRGLSVSEALFKPPEDMTFWESRFGYSIRLVLLGALIATGLGIPLGIISARPRATLSRLISLGLAVLMSIPNFVLGLLAMVVLASGLKVISVIPVWTQPGNWIVPGLVLAAMPMASIARVTRASIINVLNEDYVRTARAKGLTQARVMLVHVVRNALVPILTFLGPALMELFTGLFIVESLYSFPGFGRQYWEAVLKLDYPFIMGLTLIYAFLMMVVNILIEGISEFLDPRIRAARHLDAL